MANKERIEQLCQALESGEFEQTRGTLREMNENTGGRWHYCCLGVATVVALRSGDVSEDEAWSYTNTRGARGNYGVLSLAVVNWYGLDASKDGGRREHDPVLLSGPDSTPDDYDGVRPDGRRVATASVLNDRRHNTFRQIAAAFRRTYLEEQP